MTTAIEKELVKATKLKNLKGPRQKTLKTIVTSALELEGDDWESLSEPSQYFVNAGSRAIEEKIDIPEPNDDFNSEDEYFEEAAEEESGDDDDKEVGDGDSDADDDGDSDGDDTSDNDGEADDDGDEDGEAEDDDGVEAEEEEDGDIPGTGEDEEEDVKPKRGRRKAAAADDDEEEEEEKPTKKKAAAKKPEPKAAKGKPAAKAKAKDEKPAKKPTGPKPTGDGAQAWIKRLVIEDTTRTTEQLLSLLAKKGHTPTKLATSTIRSGMLQSLRLLKEMGKLKGVQI